MPSQIVQINSFFLFNHQKFKENNIVTYDNVATLKKILQLLKNYNFNAIMSCLTFLPKWPANYRVRTKEVPGVGRYFSPLADHFSP